MLVGSNMPPAVQALAREDIQPIGYVPVLSEVMHRVRATVVPLRYGAGIKGKVLDSFAHGIPCIMSEVAAEGVELSGELGWLIARTPAEFAEKLRAVHEDADLNAGLCAPRPRGGDKAIQCPGHPRRAGIGDPGRTLESSAWRGFLGTRGRVATTEVLLQI